jgi:hypothetical protein
MSTPFTNFILKLSTDKQALNNFQSDPSAAINAAGLSVSQRDALLSKDSQKISSAINTELPSAQGIGITVPITLTISL